MIANTTSVSMQCAQVQSLKENAFPWFLDWAEECKEFMGKLIALECKSDLLARRQSAVDLICDHLQADYGFWCWGHGHPETGRTIPVTMVQSGLDSAMREAFFMIGMRDETDTWLRNPYIPLLKEHGQVCRARHHFWSDEVWRSASLRVLMVEQTGLSEWMTCVRYPTPLQWSCVSVFRFDGRSPFTELERFMLDIACAGISWLQCDTHKLPDQALKALNEKQSQVFHLLMQGRSRKEIASTLRITTHIVNDVIKQIYQDFGTSSATELAALFLKRA
jgi:DNA-binding CsgD family transcriptional regulator